MEPSSPWLDIHRPSGPRQTDRGGADAEESDSDDESDATDEADDGTTTPWENVDAARRPSRTQVDLPSPDQLADD